MRTEHQRKRAERFEVWLEARERRPGRRNELRLAEEEASQLSPPINRDERASDLKLSYGATGAVFKRVRCCRCSRTGTFYGSIEKFAELLPDPHSHVCDRCRTHDNPPPDPTPPPNHNGESDGDSNTETITTNDDAEPDHPETSQP